MQIASSNEGRMKVAIIGTSGAGKTCFIAAMRWLGECCGDTRFISVGANGDTKKYFDDLHEKVKEGEVPPGTPKESKLEFSERYSFDDGKPPVQIDFSMRDFKGGDLRLIDADNALFQSWAQSDLLVVLIDIENLKRQGIELQDNLRDLLAVLIRNEMDAPQKRLAIVITQADKGGFSAEKHSPEAAERLLDENLHDFFDRIITSGFKETKCFLLASIGLEPETGTDGKARVPEVDGRREWRPFGYEELFDWICAFQQYEEVSRFYEVLWAKAKPFVASLAALALGGVIWRGVVFHQQYSALLKYEGCSTLEEKAEATWKMSDNDRIDKVEKRIRDYNAESENASDDAALRELQSESKTFREKARISEEQERRFKEIDIRIAAKREDILFEQIKCAMADRSGYESACELIKRYRTDRAISKNHKGEVDKCSDTLASNGRTSAKREIADFYVGGPENTQLMRKKLEKIRNFNFPNDQERAAADNAVNTMNTLMGGRPFEITQISGEGLEKKRNTYVYIATGVSETKDLKQYKKYGEGVPVETKIIDSICPQWNDDSLLQATLSWKPGQSIRVEWRRVSKLGDKCIASISSMNDWLGLLEILQPKVSMRHDDYGNFNEIPSITIKCRELPNPEEDLQLIKRFVIPGTYWQE